MTNRILVKKGAGTPSPDDLEVAELALNTLNGELYTKLSDDSVVLLNDGADDVDLSDYVMEAPEDGKQYARRNASWSEIVIPDVDLTGYATEVYVDDAVAAIPAAPVDSVNGKTGTVVLSAADVGALPNSYDPGINYPVTSVNGKTGAVNLTHTDVGAQVAGSYATETYVNNAVAAHSVDGGVY